jgi:hypothetical protein
MIYIDMIILKTKLNIYFWLNKINLPLTNKKLIDKKQVRHVFKIEKKAFKAFYCMINGKSYILKYSEELEKWFNKSEIEIKKSKIIHKTKNIASINNLKEFKKLI